MLVGLDPGSRITGYGVIAVEGKQLRAIEYGCIKTQPDSSLSAKLELIYNDVTAVISQHKPEEVIVENAFYYKNVRAAMVLGHVRGVLLLAGQRNGAHVVELSPKEIKKFVTGSGNASKDRVKYMTCRILGLSREPENEDAADALAVALAHGLSITRG